MIGEDLGASNWWRIEQADIDAFATLTRDEQYIHVDPERARSTPFGGTIAHGFLTLSLFTVMAQQCLPPISGSRFTLNYGADRLRFLRPIRSGESIRCRLHLSDCRERAAGQWLSTIALEVEVKEQAALALVATWMILTEIELPNKII